MKAWNRISLVAIAIIFSFTGCGFAASDEDQKQEKTDGGKAAIAWHSYEEGLSLGKSQNKKVFLNFYADWCHYCKTMDSQTFTDANVIDFVNQNFVAIRVDSDKNKKLAANYNVRGLPMSLFLTENGDSIGGQPGFIPAQDMLSLLKYISTDSYKKMNFKTFIESM